MSNHTIFNQAGQEVGAQYNAASDMYITHAPSQSAPTQAATPRRAAPSRPSVAPLPVPSTMWA